ncbi:class I SAM-dependent methyltransferase [Haliangium ochraceum]|uniref:Methyltransferase type 11 n=1 Tax=Haliangium ochraceum (strain DSM 14365 / JCM 11303 / SMP-2) TaxID=502025 RepID=D0LWQ4_HALO1|nr:class I SAM-dependent methyltransferase [Haliangium ochraceum]ACY14151.1 Methyltransferase type 11 [Haliangium ochraceum DSM 14365]
MDPDHYYRHLAVAYARGRCPELAELDDDALLASARAQGVRMHRFKRTAELPRVRRVLGVLKGFAPSTLLDIGSGRGAFLWPLLDEFAALRVTAIDVLAHRVADIEAVRRGGVQRLDARQVEGEELPWPDDSFDAVTILEVLEHVADPAPVAAQVVRVARSLAVATVPAKADDNPEHIRLFTPATLTELFERAGARAVRIEHVLNHMVAVIKP